MPNQDKNPQGGVQGTSYLYNYGATPNTRTAVSQKVRVLAPAYGSSNKTLAQMGMLSTFNPSHSRSVEPLRGIGFGDKIAEMVPSVTEPMSLSFERALLYLCNLWQAAGYAGGVDGPVRLLAHHRWPFDIEQQLVFSVLADADLGVPNQGLSGNTGLFNGGSKQQIFPEVTNDGTVQGQGNPGSNRGHTAIITMYEACWFTDWNISVSRDAGMIMESGTAQASDVHDFSSVYGEFMATGNDPTIGQLGSIRFADIQT